MKQKIYQIDAFANRLFEGNPAMICPFEEWISDDLMKLDMENNVMDKLRIYIK